MAWPDVTTVLDNFNRAALGATWYTGSWYGDGELSIISSTLLGGAGSWSGGYFATSYGPNCDCIVEVPTYSSVNDYVNLFLRLDSGDNPSGYKLTYRGGSGCSIARVDAGSDTRLGATFDGIFAAGDKLGFEASGSNLAVYRYTSGAWGAAIATRTDATYTGAGYFGIELSASTTRLDNLAGGTVSGGTSTPMTLTGGGTPAGTLGKSHSRTKTGGFTPGGVLAKVLTINRTLVGGGTPGGTIGKSYRSTKVGGDTPAGVLAHKLNRTLAGGGTPGGTLGHSLGRTLAGAMTPGGVLAKVLNLVRALAGGMTPGGVLSYLKAISVTFTGGLTPGGTLAKVLTILRTFTGSDTPGGTMTKVLTILRTFTGADTPGGVLSYLKAFATTFTGGMTPGGTVTKVLTLVRTLTGGMTPGGTISRALNITRTLTGGITSGGVLVKSLWRTLVGAITHAGALGQAFIPSGGTTTPMTLIGSIAPAGALINYLTTALVRWHKWRMRDHRFDKPKIWNRKR